MKTRTGIDGLRSVHFGVPDLEAAIAFHTEAWGLSLVSRAADVAYLRATGGDFYVVALHATDEPRFLQTDFTIGSRAEADALHAALTARGDMTLTTPAVIREPGGGYGFAFKDPIERRVFRVVAGAERHADCADTPDRPRQLSHLVLNSPDRDARFFVDDLGFLIIDQTKTITFLNCNDDHHSLALYYAKQGSLHHVAFEVPDIDSVMSATATMKEKGHEVGWGVGRHGPCDNVFAYFVTPGGFILEYTAEVEQVDESYRIGGPEDWVFKPGRRDQWGLALPTVRMASAEARVPFSDSLFRE